MTRRALTASGFTALVVSLTGCGADSATQFAQAKLYLDTAVAAVTAAGQQFLAGPPAPSAANASLVRALISGLSQAQSAIANVTVPADWKAGAMQVLAIIQQMSPLVSPFLGAAAPYIPLAVAVVMAFIESLPPPANTPATPPAALTLKAAERR